LGFGRVGLDWGRRIRIYGLIGLSLWEWNGVISNDGVGENETGTTVSCLESSDAFDVR